MKKILIILWVAPLFAVANNWTNYPAVNAAAPTDTYLIGTATTNEQISSASVLNQNLTNVLFNLTNVLAGWQTQFATNVSLTFVGGLAEEFTLTNTATVVNFTNFSGSAGSLSYLFIAPAVVTYTSDTNALRWLTTRPTIVTNGVISFTRYGTNVVGAYRESQ